MNEIIYILSFLIFLIGVVGSFVPVIPGPLVSYVGILLLYFTKVLPISSTSVLLLGFFMLVTTLGDYFLQVLGVKKFGGGKNAITGTIVGTLIGLLVPPVGILIGAFVGAFIGARSDTDNDTQALKAALGAFLGFILGTVLKLIYSVYIIYYTITLL